VKIKLWELEYFGRPLTYAYATLRQLSHGDDVLWAELWFVVCVGSRGLMQEYYKNYFDKLDTWSKKGGTF